MSDPVITRSLAPIFKSQFSSGAIKLGETLFREKGVEFSGVNRQIYKFKVQDYYGDKQIVQFDILASKKGDIENADMQCDCTPLKDGKPKKLCSHLWAAVVFFDAEDLLEAEFKEMNESLHRFLKELSKKAKIKNIEDEGPDRFNEPYPFYIVEIDSCEKYLCLTLNEKILKKNGEWGKAKPLQDLDLRLAKISYPEDIDALQMIQACSLQNNLKGFNLKHIYKHKALPILDLMDRTGRLYYRRKDQDEIFPMKVDFKNPWTLNIAFDKKDDVFTMSINGKRGEEEILMNDVPILFGDEEICFFHNAIFYKFEKKTDRQWVNAAIMTPQCHFEKDQFSHLMQEMQQYEFTPRFQFTKAMGVSEIGSENMTPILRIFFGEEVKAKLSFSYAESVEFEEFNISQDYYDYENDQHIIRDLIKEKSYKSQLEENGFDYKGGFWGVNSADLVDLLGALIQDNWKILADQDKPVVSYSKFSLNVSSGIDWFDLKGNLNFGDETILLPKILEAYIKNRNFVLLADGNYGLLPSKWLERNYKALDFGSLLDKEDSIQFSRAHALLVEDLLELADESSHDETFASVCLALKEFSGIEDVDIPEKLQGDLRPYQKEGYLWLNFLNKFHLGGCLADDMGLGKTIQMITLLLSEKAKGEKKPSIVVLPTSIVFNWRKEIERFGPSLSFITYTGANRKELWDQINTTDIVLTTYGIIRRDCVELAELDFNYVILDEAQAIKNHISQTAKSIKVLKAKHKVTMTGTPIENNIGELWAQFDFLLPGFLGSRERFLKNFHRKTLNSPDIDLTPVRKLIKPFMMRRTKNEVVKDLPEKVEQVIYCEMKEKQVTQYEEMSKFYRSEILTQKGSLKKGSQIKVLEALLRLRQICCHPELLKKKGEEEESSYYDSAKMETLISMLEDVVAEDHKALVFSQFTSMLAIMRRFLDEAGIPYCYLDGSVSMDKREKAVEDFQTNPKYKVFLISLKAGGVGLNLTAADYVFLYDPWWNPAIEAQAVDRTHRIGQTKTIFTYRLITKNSVEEKVHELQAAKKALADDILDASGVPSTLSKEDIQSLFLG